MGTVIGAGSVGSIVECRFTEIGQGVCAAAARADFGFVHGLDDFRGAKFLDSTCPGKGKMIRVKILDDTEGKRFALSALIVLGLSGGSSVMVLGEFIPNGFDSYVHARQSDIMGFAL